MNHIYPCFWSLIDNDNFNVLYASRSIPDDIRSIFMNHSLFDLMHPDEADRAQLDLKRSIATRSLTGSITRCRLRNLVGYKPSSDASILPGMSNADWLIVDVIVYAATDQLLLAFFHLDSGSLAARHTSACGEQFFDGAHDINYIKSLLSHQLNHHHNNNNNNNNNNNVFPTHQQQQRHLHIVDSRTKTAVLSWPERYHHEKSLTALVEARVGTASCFDFSRHSSRDVSPNGTLAIADHIIIPYGCITFVMTTTTIHQSSVPSVVTATPLTTTTTVAAQTHSVHIAVKQQQEPHQEQKRFHLSSYNDNHDYNSHLQHNTNYNRLPSLHHLPHLDEEPNFGSQAQQIHIGSNTAPNSSGSNKNNHHHDYQIGRPVLEMNSTSHPFTSSSRSTSTTSSPTASTKRRYSRYSEDVLNDHPMGNMDNNTKPFIPYARRNVSTITTSTSSATASSSSRATSPTSHSYYRSSPPSSMSSTAPMYYQRHSPPPLPLSANHNNHNSLTTTAAHAHVRKRRHSSSARVHSHHYNSHNNTATTTNNHNNNSSSSHSNSASVVQNRCESCGTDSSPEWRKGPSGHKTLCNACGLRWKRSLTRKEKQVQQQQQQQLHHHQHSSFQHHHSSTTSTSATATTPHPSNTTTTFPITMTTTTGSSHHNTTRYSAPSSPVSSCSSSSSSSASSSPTSLVDPMTPHHYTSPTSTSCHKSFYDHHSQQQPQQSQHYDPIFRY